jgi:raffinose/stachyose/melibiose transport system substrate-binding protein
MIKAGVSLVPKRTLVLVAASLFLVGLATTVFAGATQEKGAKQITLKMLSWKGGDEKKAFDAFVAEYTKVKPNVKVDHQSQPGTGISTYVEFVETAMASNNAPDMYENICGYIPRVFIDAGKAESLDAYWAKYNLDSVIVPSAKESVKINGKLWGIPIEMRGCSFWYRTDLWSKAGLAVPKTYKELEALCDKAEAAGLTPLSMGGKYSYMTMRMLDYLLEVTAGPALHDQLNNLETSWNRPEVVQAYKMLDKWVKNWITPGYMGRDPGEGKLDWYRGIALMVYEGTWMETTIKQDGQDVKNFDFFMQPTDHKPQRSYGWAENFMLYSKSPNKDAAAEFLNWFVQPEQQKKGLGSAFSSTATIGVRFDPAIMPSSSKWQQELSTIDGVFLPADQALPAELYHKFWEYQDGVANGTMTAERAAEEMQKTVEAFKK